MWQTLLRPDRAPWLIGGASVIALGTAFLATDECASHDYHKQKIVEAASEDTVYTDVFAINWPPRSPVRVIKNSITDLYARDLLGHGPDDFPREEIAREHDYPVYRFSTNSPMRYTTGDLEPLARYAGQICGSIDAVRPAADVVRGLAKDALEALDRLGRLA